jgi:hypothetical protein
MAAEAASLQRYSRSGAIDVLQPPSESFLRDQRDRIRVSDVLRDEFWQPSGFPDNAPVPLMAESWAARSRPKIKIRRRRDVAGLRDRRSLLSTG